MFFHLGALIYFSKIMFNVFFFMFFLLPSLIRFWIFSDLKQRNKTLWAMVLMGLEIIYKD